MQQSEARDYGEQQVVLEEVMEIWVLEVVKVLWEDQLEAEEAEEHDQQQQGLADVLLPPDPQAHQSQDHGAQQAQAQKQVQEQQTQLLVA